MGSRRGGGRLAWGSRLVAFVLLGVAVALMQTATTPGFDPTGMIYVDIARHIAKGDGIASSILFPSHVPKVPSPISLWPPLYPAAIAGLSKLGADAAIASRMLSIGTFGVSVGFVWLLGSLVFGEGVGTMAALLLMAWPPVTGIAARALSENLFVMLVLLSVLLGVQLIRSDRSPSRLYAKAAVGGLAMAGAALTRYPGLPLIVIGSAALLLNLRGRSWKERLAMTLVWLSAALVPPLAWLVRNRFVTGSFMGAGRPPDDSGFAFHVIYAAKAVAADGLQLLWQITILPEALGVDSRVMAFAVLGVAGVLLFGVIRSSRVRRALGGALGAPVASREGRFVVAVGLGYWAAMAAVRSVTAFELLNTRMMMPAYPLVLVGIVAVLATLAERMGLPRRALVWTVAILFVGSVAVVGLPRSVSAGGPRLRPDPAPAWVSWIAVNTPPDAPIVGNRSYDVPFYLERPAYSFQVFAVYRTGNRFDRDCRLIASQLAALGWTRAYLVLHTEDGEFDAEVMGRRYGPTIARVLRGEPALPVRLVARDPQFVVYEMLGLQWNCNHD